MIPSNKESISPIDILDNIFRTTLTHLKFENINLLTIPIQNNNIITTAAVCGLSIPQLFNKNTVYALFLINNNIIQCFNLKEWNFIIAHECGHILHNHTLLSLIVNLPEMYSKIISIIEKNPIYHQAYQILKVLIPSLIENRITTPERDVIRTSELEADRFAINYTGDLETAEKVLRKLGNGNIDVPSHFFEYDDKKIPALTLEERIKNIRNSSILN